MADYGANQGSIGLVRASPATGFAPEGADAANQRGHDGVGAVRQMLEARVTGWVRGLLWFVLRGTQASGRRTVWLPGSSSPGSTSARRLAGRSRSRRPRWRGSRSPPAPE